MLLKQICINSIKNVLPLLSLGSTNPAIMLRGYIASLTATGCLEQIALPSGLRLWIKVWRKEDIHSW